MSEYIKKEDIILELEHLFDDEQKFKEAINLINMLPTIDDKISYLKKERDFLLKVRAINPLDPDFMDYLLNLSLKAKELLELPIIDDKSDLEVIKDYCSRTNNCDINCIIDNGTPYCVMKKILEVRPENWDLDAIKDAVKTIKEIK